MGVPPPPGPKGFPIHVHSRPQSPSFLGHVVGYKLSRVALGTRMIHVVLRSGAEI